MTARVGFDFTATTALITGGTSGIGHAVAFLCTEQSSYTSGAVFVVDGASDCV
jgi:NAD(P)-dependent dehydrogenase (short-subunit alcohol dehydrogenase family)